MSSILREGPLPEGWRVYKKINKPKQMPCPEIGSHVMIQTIATDVMSGIKGRRVGLRGMLYEVDPNVVWSRAEVVGRPDRNEYGVVEWVEVVAPGSGKKERRKIGGFAVPDGRKPKGKQIMRRNSGDAFQ